MVGGTYLLLFKLFEYLVALIALQPSGIVPFTFIGACHITVLQLSLISHQWCIHHKAGCWLKQAKSALDYFFDSHDIIDRHYYWFHITVLCTLEILLSCGIPMFVMEYPLKISLLSVHPGIGYWQLFLDCELTVVLFFPQLMLELFSLRETPFRTLEMSFCLNTFHTLVFLSLSF